MMGYNDAVKLLTKESATTSNKVVYLVPNIVIFHYMRQFNAKEISDGFALPFTEYLWFLMEGDE